MKIVFEADAALDRRTAKILTHPEERERWQPMREAIKRAEDRVGLIDARSDRIVRVPLEAIAALESEDRMCGVTLITGERYLLNKRLKLAEEQFAPPHFIRINNRTIVGAEHIREFSSADHARIQVILTNSSKHMVSRYYIQQFRRGFK
ncbi:LytTR family DNA-binding domain-containing protein [Saccharibacillus sp. CPCC 101409]|uniref:LytTR family DNA-binding domain-containing protein n=1 Tax=Saccharibacillus sp. CPCC 101409 TaxID=3058041 RepID=UPI002671B94A|nr:LytTR family DNA-binding domain-containing protein [Saccharibacillus sp. CPCC 101409]MDO3411507.1 LytTR family DNA-binding domain-containing protein [Saccharibacillus sp. CPCC 101409]